MSRQHDHLGIPQAEIWRTLVEPPEPSARTTVTVRRPTDIGALSVIIAARTRERQCGDDFIEKARYVHKNVSMRLDTNHNKITQDCS